MNRYGSQNSLQKIQTRNTEEKRPSGIITSTKNTNIYKKSTKDLTYQNHSMMSDNQALHEERTPSPNKLSNQAKSN